MSLLDKIAEKARNTTGKKRKVAIVLSSMLDYVAGTHSEMRKHQKAFLNEDTMRDYELYERSVNYGTMVEGIGTMLADQYCPCKPVVYTLGADCVVRVANNLIYVQKLAQKKDEPEDDTQQEPQDFTGFIGTARTLAYKLAGKLKKGNGALEDGLDDEDPFEDEAFQIPTSYSADAEGDEEPDFGMGEEEDSGNKLF